MGYCLAGYWHLIKKWPVDDPLTSHFPELSVTSRSYYSICWCGWNLKLKNIIKQLYLYSFAWCFGSFCIKFVVLKLKKLSLTTHNVQLLFIAGVAIHVSTSQLQENNHFSHFSSKKQTFLSMQNQEKQQHFIAWKYQMLKMCSFSWYCIIRNVIFWEFWGCSLQKTRHLLR